MLHAHGTLEYNTKMLSNLDSIFSYIIYILVMSLYPPSGDGDADNCCLVRGYLGPKMGTPDHHRRGTCDLMIAPLMNRKGGKTITASD